MRGYAFRDLVRDLLEDITQYDIQSQKFRPQGDGGTLPSRIGLLRTVGHLMTPSLITCTLYRISRWLWDCRLIWVAVIFSRINKLVSRASIHPSAKIGGGLYIPHPAHIVLYGHAGKCLKVYGGGALLADSGVTLTWKMLDNCPSLGDFVVIGSKAVVRGSVTVGDCSVVAFKLFLQESVPDNITVIPARLRQYQINKSSQGKPMT